MTITIEQAKMLRQPFPAEVIGKLPKGGTYLDYVGHAATTDRLLTVDPTWSWEPVAFDQRGLPAFDEQGGLWIRLTVCGVTRLGYGHAAGKKGPDATKEAIGDALRNAAMRFGVALDLWAKEDLTLTTKPIASADDVQAFIDLIAIAADEAALAEIGQRVTKVDLDEQQRGRLRAAFTERQSQLKDAA